LDVLILGVALNVYAYSIRTFRPEVTGIELPTAQPTPEPTLAASTPPAATETPQGTESAAPQPTATETPVDQGMWGAKFPGKFTDGDDVEKTANSYKSHDVNITIDKEQLNGVVYFVADIYIRNLQNFKSSYADNICGGKLDWVINQANDDNAILAINGDDSGNNLVGYSIRSHDAIHKQYRNTPYQDVLVMYMDGSMKTFANKDFNFNAEKANIWQLWSFGPMLLDGNGQPMTSFNSTLGIEGSHNPRTAIGYYEPGHYCYVIVDGRQTGYSYPGLSFKDLSQLICSTLHCKVAYNLDGGQSTTMVFNGEIINKPYLGGRRVSDIVYVGETN
jgi:exopolysaccharide biosynthesis protein